MTSQLQITIHYDDYSQTSPDTCPIVSDRILAIDLENR